MRQHFSEMLNMIHELKAGGYDYTDEQQIHEVIHSLAKSWEHMKVNMMHNDNIRTFNDISHHLELEDERQEATKAFCQLYVTESSSRKTSGFKHKRGNNNYQKEKGKGTSSNNKKPNTRKRKRGKYSNKKKDKAKMYFYNCGKLGRLARECTEPKKGTTGLHKIC